MGDLAQLDMGAPAGLAEGVYTLRLSLVNTAVAKTVTLTGPWHQIFIVPCTRSLLSLVTPYTAHPIPHILHPTPYTLHSQPYILHPAPHTLRLTPCTLHPTTYTLHPTPYTLHSNPFTTHNPQRSESHR